MGYKIQIDNSVRDATDEEAAAFDAQEVKTKAEADAIAAKAVARKAVLDKLGLSANEAQALLG